MLSTVRKKGSLKGIGCSRVIIKKMTICMAELYKEHFFIFEFASRALGRISCPERNLKNS
jgi:hypothetical protein